MWLILKRWGGHGRDTTGLECSFAFRTLYLSEEDESWGRQVGVSYTDSQSELPSIAMGRDGNTKLIVEHDWREDTAC